MKKSSSLQNQLRHKISWEIIWIVIAVLFTALVLLPILSRTSHFHFWTTNAVFVFIFITVTRILFTLKYSFWSRSQYFKFFLVLACLPLLFYLISRLNHFLTFLDDYSLAQFLAHLPEKSAREMTQYIRTEMIFFAVGSIMATLVLPFRLVVSMWRQRNRGTV